MIPSLFQTNNRFYPIAITATFPSPFWSIVLWVGRRRLILAIPKLDVRFIGVNCRTNLTTAVLLRGNTQTIVRFGERETSKTLLQTWKNLLGLQMNPPLTGYPGRFPCTTRTAFHWNTAFDNPPTDESVEYEE